MTKNITTTGECERVVNDFAKQERIKGIQECIDILMQLPPEAKYPIVMARLLTKHKLGIK